VKFNVDGYCGVAADRRRDLGWNPSTLLLNYFFFSLKNWQSRKNTVWHLVYKAFYRTYSFRALLATLVVL
jgi:hypothetical protein